MTEYGLDFKIAGRFEELTCLNLNGSPFSLSKNDGAEGRRGLIIFSCLAILVFLVFRVE